MFSLNKELKLCGSDLYGVRPYKLERLKLYEVIRELGGDSRRHHHRH